MYKFFTLGFLVALGVLGSSVSAVQAAGTTTSTGSSTASSSIPAVVATTTATTTVTGVASTTASTTSTTTMPDRVAIEKRVREYFVDVPVMVQIARCESNFRQYADSGKPFRGGANGGMVGVFQLYEKIHTAEAQALGFDITTLEGNLGYARHIYTQEGTTPWASCEPTPVLYDNSALRIELLTKLVELLQQLLALKLAGK